LMFSVLFFHESLLLYTTPLTNASQIASNALY
jgi:hypothetical protein